MNRPDSTYGGQRDTVRHRANRSMGLFSQRSLVPLLGAGAVLIWICGIVGALLLAPWFSFLEHALSALGRAGRRSAPLFNGALVVSGLLGILFVAGLGRQTGNAISRLGIALFGVAATTVVFLGAFPTPHPFHYPASVGFYLVLTFAIFVYGTGIAVAGSVKVGVAWIWLGIVHTTAWIAWWALLDDQGIAGPEALGASIFSVWVLGLAWRSYRTSA